MTCAAVGGDLEIAEVARDNAGAIRLRFTFTTQRECLLLRSSVTALERPLRLLRAQPGRSTTYAVACERGFAFWRAEAFTMRSRPTAVATVLCPSPGAEMRRGDALCLLPGDVARSPCHLCGGSSSSRDCGGDSSRSARKSSGTSISSAKKEAQSGLTWERGRSSPCLRMQSSFTLMALHFPKILASLIRTAETRVRRGPPI